MTQSREQYRSPESHEYTYAFERDDEGDSKDFEEEIREEADLLGCEVVAPYTNGRMTRVVVGTDEYWRLVIYIGWRGMVAGMRREDIEEQVKRIRRT